MIGKRRLCPPGENYSKSRKSGWTPRSGCDELLKLADEYKRASMIDGDGWRELVEKATAFWAHSVEGFEDWK